MDFRPSNFRPSTDILFYFIFIFINYYYYYYYYLLICTSTYLILIHTSTYLTLIRIFMLFCINTYIYVILLIHKYIIISSSISLFNIGDCKN